MTTPAISVLYGCALGLMAVALGTRVSLARMGGFDADALRTRVRVHANLLENAPMFILGLLAAELCVGDSRMLHGMGLVFVVARVSHAVGLTGSSGRSVPRFLGSVVTWTLISAIWLYALVLAWAPGV